MSNFAKRYQMLNTKQKNAVDNIEGPLLVIAGPGTGKTELLSVRTANILQKTDTLPSSILCLTFTESGAAAMRNRLIEIIGKDAYKVQINTFHGFGTEIMNQFREFFFQGAQFQPADELTRYELLRAIFSTLAHNNPLSGMNNDVFTYLNDVQSAISDLKRSGLNSDELRAIIQANALVIEEVNSELKRIFANRVSQSTLHLLADLAKKVAEIPQPQYPPATTPYADVLALSLAHTIDQAVEADSTKPLTVWKNKWCEKDENGDFILKDTGRQTKLLEVSFVYNQYISQMYDLGLFDFDDMILNVVHAIETDKVLRANLQEKYQYIMVDEFQDTNLAQLRLLFSLADSNNSPNIMAVGDDDQAIYSFQGADISNIHRFRKQYQDPSVIVLTDNYRSTSQILQSSREVILQGSDRLENSVEGLSKALTSKSNSDSHMPVLNHYANTDDEKFNVARDIQTLISSKKILPSSIAIIARRHQELIAILPYLENCGVKVNYEKHNNALDHELIKLTEKMLMLVQSISDGDHDLADSVLPEIISHPSFKFAATDIYELSLKSWRSRGLWLETMQTNPVFQPFADWLLVRSAAIQSETLEQQIDNLIGLKNLAQQTTDEANLYSSPIYDYFFSKQVMDNDASSYLDSIAALRSIRSKLREHYATEQPTVQMFLEFIETHRELDYPIPFTRHSSSDDSKINLLTAHKAKGLEFDHVYIIGAIDSTWGEQVRTRSKLISYPANLMIGPPGDSYDERLRLFYVAMTRAKINLNISYGQKNSQDKDLLVASFLTDINIERVDHPAPSYEQQIKSVELDWTSRFSNSSSEDLKTVLGPTLEHYRLSATHLVNFLDVTKSGPSYFLLNNLLRFPQSKSASASYGTAVHAALQYAHSYIKAHSGDMRPIEDVLGVFEQKLKEQYLSDADFESFYNKGIDHLSAFLKNKYHTFSTNQITELGFSGQDSTLDGAVKINGALDLVDIDKDRNTITVTDYKTGKPSRSWKGKTEYEKIKLHKYRQQLMFYQLLVENSRDYGKYDFQAGILQFVEPSQNGDILALEADFDKEELDEFSNLVKAVWSKIISLDLPDVSMYEKTLQGIRNFERDLLT